MMQCRWPLGDPQPGTGRLHGACGKHCNSLSGHVACIQTLKLHMSMHFMRAEIARP